MSSSGMLRRVALVGTDVSEERIASIIRVAKIVEPGTSLAVISNRSTLRRNTSTVSSRVACLRSVIQLLVTANVPSSSILVTLLTGAIRFPETSLFTRFTRRSLPEDGILQSRLSLASEVWLEKSGRGT
jgi:hypothetical protein